MNAALDAKAAASLVTDDFTLTDETINFGVGACFLPPEGPYVFNKAGLITNLAIRVAEAITTNLKYTTLLLVHDCENIAVRWQGEAIAVGHIPNNTALAGESIRWKGIELLTIDTTTSPLLIKSVQSSSDWFWYTYYAGEKIVYQKHHYPACLCQDVAPGLNADGQCTAKPPAPAPTA